MLNFTLDDFKWHVCEWLTENLPMRDGDSGSASADHPFCWSCRLPPRRMERGLEVLTASSFNLISLPQESLIHDRFSFATKSCVERQGGRCPIGGGKSSFQNRAKLGAILHDSGAIMNSFFQNAPTDYVWQGSLDGRSWHDLEGTRIEKERVSFGCIAWPRPSIFASFVFKSRALKAIFRLSGKLNFTTIRARTFRFQTGSLR